MLFCAVRHFAQSDDISAFSCCPKSAGEVPRITPNASENNPRSFQSHQKSSLEACLNPLRIQKPRLVKHHLIWGLSFEPRRDPKVSQNAPEALQDAPKDLPNWKNIVFKSTFVNDAVLATILLTIFNDSNAFLTRKTLIFAGRRNVLSTFQKKQISCKSLDLGAVWPPEMLPKLPLGDPKIQKFQSWNPKIQS